MIARSIEWVTDRPKFLLVIGLLAAAVAGRVVAQSNADPLYVLVLCVLAVAMIAALADPYVGLLLTFVVMPLDTYGRVIFTSTPITAYQIMMVTVLVSLFYREITGRMRLRLGKAEGVAALVLFAALWSLPFTMSWAETSLACVRVAFQVLLFVACTQLVNTRKRLIGAVAVITGTLVVVFLLALAQAAFPGVLPLRETVQGTIDRVNIMRVAAFYHDPNTLGGIAAMTTAAFLAALAHARRVLPAVLWGAASVLGAAITYLTFSRGSWFALAASVVVVAMTAPPDRRRKLVIGLAALAVAASVVAPTLIVSRVLSAFDIQRDTSAATRYYMYVSAVEMVAARPVFGTGLAAFDQLYPAYRDARTIQTILRPHEIPVAFVAETGVAGLVTVIAVAWVAFLAVWRHRGRPWTPWEAAAVAGVVAIGVGSLFEYYLYLEYLWIFAAFWVVATRLERQERKALDV